jgi:hypothetical protein
MLPPDIRIEIFFLLGLAYRSLGKYAARKSVVAIEVDGASRGHKRDLRNCAMSAPNQQRDQIESCRCEGGIFFVGIFSAKQEKTLDFSKHWVPKASSLF